MQCVQTLIKAVSEEVKEVATVKDVIKSTLKFSVGAVLGATVDHVTSKLIEMLNNQNDVPLPNPPIMLPELNQARSGKTRRRRTVYKRHPNKASIHLTSDNFFIIFKLATIGCDVTAQITSEIYLFESIMKQNVIVNEFNRNMLRSQLSNQVWPWN